jgi:hypothetical protein
MTTDRDDGSVSIASTITNWTLANATDLLALEWDFAVPGGTGYAGCGAASSNGVGTTACGSSPFRSSTSAWSGGFRGLEGLGPSGPVALVQWNSSASEDGQSSLVSVGASQASRGDAQLVVAAPDANAGAVNFGFSVALAVPILPIPLVLHGSLLPYAGGAVIAAAVVAAGLVLVRRREARLLAEL